LSAITANDSPQELNQFILSQKQWHTIADHRIHKSHASLAIAPQENDIKRSGSVIEDDNGKSQTIFFDKSYNLFVSDYTKNRILKYSAHENDQQEVVVAEHLNAPRAIYVTDDGSQLYVVDNTGMHRFKLDPEEKNLGAATLLFRLPRSSEIYTMIVDEADFNTIYCYDIAQRRIFQCSLNSNRAWRCRKIIQLTSIEKTFFFFQYEN